MNWNHVSGNWNLLSAKVKEAYGELTDNDFLKLKGEREELIAVFQKRYDMNYDEAKAKLLSLERRLGCL